MARRLRNAAGEIVRIEVDAIEMAQMLGITDTKDSDGRVTETAADTLARWGKVIPALRVDDGTAVYGFASVKELNQIKKRAALLRTQMSETAVQNIEAKGLLDAYAALAEDCPPGITAHVWRSYGLIVLMQIRYGQMLDANELAQRAGLTEADRETGERVVGVATAERHIRLLRALGYLEEGTGRWEGQWQHKGLPAAWRGV
jgi:hypothetical protein